MAYHTMALRFEGPESAEFAAKNPFSDYRLNVTFLHEVTGRAITVPGYYAGDGEAADTGATAGNIWEAKFTPPEPGEWRYSASFRTGDNVAVNLDAQAGVATSFDGAAGAFSVAPSDKSGVDFRAHGLLLQEDGSSYLTFSGTGDVFLKAGVGGPENFLAYNEFDGTADRDGDGLHRYELHRPDFDVSARAYTWDGGRGDEILGAIRYVAEQGLNSLYVITNTLAGDGDDVWPWLTPDAGARRFDVSKLDQWQRVFEYAQTQGVHINMLLNEEENVLIQNGGDLGVERMLYYREMVARFSHLNAVTFNVSEETRMSAAQTKAAMDYLDAVDGYGRPITVHTFPGKKAEVYTPLKGFESMDGASLQSSPNGVYRETLRWLDESEQAGDPWFVAFDENGPFDYGVTLDDEYQESRVKNDAEQDVYMNAVWGHFMAGGSGAEAYFGYSNTQHTIGELARMAGVDVALQEPGKVTGSGDLDTEWYGTRATLWSKMAAARDFFSDLPLQTMTTRSDLLPQNAGLAKLSAAVVDYAMTDGSDIYAIYLSQGSAGGRAAIRLLDGGSFDVAWIDPATGEVAKIDVVSGARNQIVSLGDAPYSVDKPWAIRLTSEDAPLPPPPPPAEEEPLEISGVGYAVSSYDGGDQDKGAFDVSPDGLSITQATNSWESVALSGAVTANTVLAFDFASADEGEIHAIGLETDASPTQGRFFKVHGTQNWGVDAFDNQYQTGAAAQSYEIRVADFLEVGTAYDRIVFATDEDRSGATAQSVFSNIRLFEDDAPPPPPPSAGELVVNGAARAVTSFDDFKTANRQDFGDFALADDGRSLVKQTNSWETVSLDAVVTEDTVLRFSFASDDEGEVHAIGLETDASPTQGRFFKVHGTQNWGVDAFDNQYQTGAAAQSYEIRVADFLEVGSAIDRIVFATDEDRSGATAQSVFSDVSLTEDGAPPPPPSVGTTTVTVAAQVSVDGEQAGIGAVDATQGGSDDDLEIGGGDRTGLLFRDVALPAGATVTDARLTVTSQRGQSDAAALEVRLLDDASVAGLSGTDALTDPGFDSFGFTPWSVTEAWSDGQKITSPDLSGLVQDLVDADPQADGTVDLLFSLAAASGVRRIDPEEFGDDLAAQLTLTYETDAAS